MLFIIFEAETDTISCISTSQQYAPLICISFLDVCDYPTLTSKKDRAAHCRQVLVFATVNRRRCTPCIIFEAETDTISYISTNWQYAPLICISFLDVCD
jgi:hypothetical protein